MKILIVENNKTDLDHLKKLIIEFFSEQDIVLKIDELSSSQNLTNTAYKYDFLFLNLNKDHDIIKGIQAKKAHPKIHIILTSVHKKYLIDGYRIKASRFFLKPISHAYFKREMKELFEDYYPNDISFYDTKIMKRRIYLKEILYIDFYDKHSFLILKNGQKIKTTYPLHYWSEKLSKYSFVQCYKSILVNCNYIQSYSKTEILLTTGTSLPISRNYKPTFISKYLSVIEQQI